MANQEGDVLAGIFLMQALVDTHPDKPALLRAFDAKISSVQLSILSFGESPGLPQHIREAIERFRAEIVCSIERDKL